MALPFALPLPALAMDAAESGMTSDAPSRSSRRFLPAGPSAPLSGVEVADGEKASVRGMTRAA